MPENYNKTNNIGITREVVDSFLEKFATKNVLVIGDVMIDSYLWGGVNRISPEAPIPIVSVSRREYRLGGAANVALNIKALGGTAYLCSVIGNDDNSEIFKQLLAKHNLSDDGIICHHSRKTTNKTRIISGSQHLLRVDDEIDTNINLDLSELLLSKLKTICIDKKIDLIIFEDYDKGVLTEYNIKKSIDYAKEKNIATAVDPKKRNFSFYQNVDLFKPNHKEFCDGVKCEIEKSDTKSLTEHGKLFVSEMGTGMLLLTLSEHGVFVCDATNCYQYPAEIRDIADVSGAGDTVISVAGLLLCSGANQAQIAKISNIAGGLVCEKAGVVPIDPDDLKNEF